MKNFPKFPLFFIILSVCLNCFSQSPVYYNKDMNPYSITFFGKYNDDFLNENSSNWDSGYSEDKLTYEAFLNSWIYKTGQILANMSKTELEKYYHRQMTSMDLSDIHWCLYLYLKDNRNNSDSLSKYYSLYQTLYKIMALSRTLKEIDYYGTDRIIYSNDGLITFIDTTAIYYSVDKVSRIGDLRIEYDANMVKRIGGLTVEYNTNNIRVIGERININKPILNRRYKRLSYFEQQDFLDRQKTLPCLIGIHNVLSLFIMNKKLDNDTISQQYFHLLSTVKTAIIATQKYRCDGTVSNKYVNCKFGRIEYIDSLKIEYFFDHITKIDQFKIEYFFERVSRVGDLDVQWHFDEIFQIGNQRIRSIRDSADFYGN